MRSRRAPDGAQRAARDRKPHGEEREERIQRDRVLDLHEGDAPDGGHGDEDEQGAHPREATGVYAMDVTTLDTLGRPLRDLRISVTDRCNFRCVYCMPKEVFGARLPLPRAARAPDVRGDRPRRGRLRRRRGAARSASRAASRSCGATSSGWSPCSPSSDVDLTLTTNGSLLPAEGAGRSRTPACERVTVSLDSLDDAQFRALNDVDFPVARVLEGIEAARAAGLPVKVNAVIKRGANEDQIVPMAAFFREQGHTLRFIEYMDVGHTNGWRLDDVVSGQGDRRGPRRGLSASSRSRPGTAARSQTAFATGTAGARSA